MNRLVAIFSFCLLLVAGHSVEEPQESQSQELPDSTTPWIEEGFPNGSEELPELVVPTIEEEITDVHKINWLPVWEEQEHPRFAREVVGKPVGTTQTPEISTPKDTVEHVLLPKDNKECPNNAERGLTNLVRVARPLLPVPRLRNILANALEDAQVQDLVKLLRSDGLKAQVQRLRATKEHQVLHDYICRRLKLDPSYHVDFVRVFLDVNTFDPPTSKLPNRRPGVRGLLLDIRDALPRSVLRDMYLKLYSSDSELASAVRLIRGSEFRRILRDLRSVKEYRSLTAELEKAGLPLRQLNQLVANALGWTTVDMGSEAVIWSV